MDEAKTTYTMIVSEQDAQLIVALRRRDEAAFRSLYHSLYPMVERLVIRHNGTKADAADVFQDMLLVLMDKVNAENWQLTASLKTYTYAVSHHLWLKRLHRQARFDRLDDHRMNDLADDNPETWPTEPLAHRLTGWLGQITGHCQRLIQALFFDSKKPGDAGYKNSHTAHNQQYKCLQQIRRVADRHPLA
jgi:DNA-directed RNA polymerase specialized sigma24 family protein